LTKQNRKPVKPTEIKWYGWKADTPDQRDKIFKYELVPQYKELPPSVDLRKDYPFVIYDQGNLGSCTSNAIGAALQYDMLKQKEQAFIPSRLFIYYNERVIEGTVREDAGAEIRDGIKTVAAQGACPESIWKYVIRKFATKPPARAYASGMLHQALQYYRLPRTLDAMKTCLASGFPFTFGFMVYESFETKEVATTGIVPMPGEDESALGGHAVLAMGYDDSQKRFLVRNSWGKGWGMEGYFTMPYEYLLNENLADDFWQIKLVE
jgi:C1A family cysteine protease